jgi:hypothetical protein
MDGRKNNERLDELLDEPTFAIPKPDFALLKSKSKVTREIILGSTSWAVDPFSYVEKDLSSLNEDVKRLLGSESTALGSIAKYFSSIMAGKSFDQHWCFCFPER